MRLISRAGMSSLVMLCACAASLPAAAALQNIRFDFAVVSGGGTFNPGDAFSVVLRIDDVPSVSQPGEASFNFDLAQGAALLSSPFPFLNDHLTGGVLTVRTNPPDQTLSIELNATDGNLIGALSIISQDFDVYFTRITAGETDLADLLPVVLDHGGSAVFAFEEFTVGGQPAAVPPELGPNFLSLNLVSGAIVPLPQAAFLLAPALIGLGVTARHRAARGALQGASKRG